MATTTTLDGKLVTECDSCDGHGYHPVGEMIGPDERRGHARIECSTCHGDGWVPLWCTYCGRPEHAVVIDSDGLPKCATCYEQDHPGRRLPEAA